MTIRRSRRPGMIGDEGICSNFDELLRKVMNKLAQLIAPLDVVILLDDP
jgi:hypothetical protein